MTEKLDRLTLPENVLSKLWIESFRYCITRKTYAVSEFCSNYREHFEQVPNHAKEIIEKDLFKEINRGLVGHDCDREDWRSLYDFILQQQNI